MVELEKKKVKILTDIYKELVYMNKSDLEKMFIPKENMDYGTWCNTDKADTETPESI